MMTRLRFVSCPAVLVLSLFLTAPVAAAPILVEIHGTVESSGGLNHDLFFPDIVVGTPFSALLTFLDPPAIGSAFFNMDLNFGAQEFHRFGIYDPDIIGVWPAMTYLGIASPGTMQSVPANYTVNVTKAFFELDAGWQTGTFTFLGENILTDGEGHPIDVIGAWTGRVNSATVPEPATLLLSLVGVGGLLVRRRSANSTQ